jgi:hypothetical protein
VDEAAMSTPALVAGNGSDLCAHYFRRKRGLNIKIKLSEARKSPAQFASAKRAIVINYNRCLPGRARHRPGIRVLKASFMKIKVKSHVSQVVHRGKLPSGRGQASKQFLRVMSMDRH